MSLPANRGANIILSGDCLHPASTANLENLGPEAAKPRRFRDTRPKPMKSKFTCRSGFTLVELLVVITIIVVLAGIILATAGRMRRSADEAVTTANLRQVGVALITYTVDNGRFPNKNGGQDPVWDRAIFGNLGYTDSLPAGTSAISASGNRSLSGVAGIFASPGDKEPRTNDTYKRSFAIVPWTCNLLVGTQFRGWKNLPFDKGVRYAILDSPQKAAMVVQAYYGVANTSNNLGAGGHAYHDIGGLAKALGTYQQVLFADGHIEKVPANIKTADFIRQYWPGTVGNTN